SSPLLTLPSARSSPRPVEYDSNPVLPTPRTSAGLTRLPAPMLASPGDAPLVDAALAYEPKYDGIRALIELGRGPVRIQSRLGNDKTAQFPDITTPLARFARTLKAPVVLYGEIVALDARGEPAGFQRLQGRIHGAKGDPRR